MRRLSAIVTFVTLNILLVSVKADTSEDPNVFSCVHNALHGLRKTIFSFHGKEYDISGGPTNLVSTYNSPAQSPAGLPFEIPRNNTSKVIINTGTNTIIFHQRDSLKNVKEEIESYITPASTLQEHIRYLLFTNENTDNYHVMPENGSVDGTFWNPQAKTKVIIHGLTATFWVSPIKNIWTQHIFEVKDAFLKKDPQKEKYNVVVVDWTSLSTVPLSHYPEASNSTKLAGQDLAQFLINLKNAGNIASWELVHIIGHSLGAHVAGVAGNRIQNMTSGDIVPRITGLDPAGPCFDTSSGKLTDKDATENLLDKTDAKFVDIIHTNMGNIIKSVAGRYGSVMEAGHVDFYPNGGEEQPGCSFLDDRLHYCSHQKSVIYYAKSVTEKLLACPCDSWDGFRSSKCTCTREDNGHYMGEPLDTEARGKLYLTV